MQQVLGKWGNIATAAESVNVEEEDKLREEHEISCNPQQTKKERKVGNHLNFSLFLSLPVSGDRKMTMASFRSSGSPLGAGRILLHHHHPSLSFSDFLIHLLGRFCCVWSADTWQWPRPVAMNRKSTFPPFCLSPFIWIFPLFSAASGWVPPEGLDGLLKRNFVEKMNLFGCYLLRRKKDGLCGIINGGIFSRSLYGPIITCWRFTV